VRGRTEQRGNIVRIWIEDNGIGIPPDQHERVFRVFERLNGARYAGTGIGLSIVRKGIERMGGKIGLESQPGSGSRFWIDLPKFPADASSSSFSSSSSPLQSAPAPRGAGEVRSPN
jgi:signal transduction histidine kinase